MKITIELTDAEVVSYAQVLRRWLAEPGEVRIADAPAPVLAPIEVPVPAAAPAAAVEAPSPVQAMLNALPKLTAEKRAAAEGAFRTFLREWLEGWEMDGETQPDRVKLMENLGSGPNATGILVLAYERLSLQKLVSDTLHALGAFGADQDTIDRIAAHIVQVSAPCGFPELGGTYDYTNRWRRG